MPVTDWLTHSLRTANFARRIVWPEFTQGKYWRQYWHQYWPQYWRQYWTHICLLSVSYTYLPAVSQLHIFTYCQSVTHTCLLSVSYTYLPTVSQLHIFAYCQLVTHICLLSVCYTYLPTVSYTYLPSVSYTYPHRESTGVSTDVSTDISTDVISVTHTVKVLCIKFSAHLCHSHGESTFYKISYPSVPLIQKSAFTKLAVHLCHSYRESIRPYVGGTICRLLTPKICPYVGGKLSVRTSGAKFADDSLTDAYFGL